MKLKFDSETGAVVTVEKEGVHFPIYVDDDGKDIDVDVPNLFIKVQEVSTEAKNYRKDRSALKEKFKAFDEIEDVDEWKKGADTAIETVKNYDAKQLVDAGKVDTGTSAERRQRLTMGRPSTKSQR